MRDCEGHRGTAAGKRKNGSRMMRVQEEISLVMLR